MTKMSYQDIYQGQDIYWIRKNFPPGRLFRTGLLLGTLEYAVEQLFWKARNKGIFLENEYLVPYVNRYL